VDRATAFVGAGDKAEAAARQRRERLGVVRRRPCGRGRGGHPPFGLRCWWATAAAGGSTEAQYSRRLEIRGPSKVSRATSRMRLRVACLVLMPGGAPYVGPLKTPASYRIVPLPRVVVDALTAHLAAFPAIEVELLDTTSKPTTRRRPASFIFTTSAGLPIRRTRFSDVWRTAAKAAELPAGASFHDLRHYYASLLIQHGESVKVVQSGSAINRRSKRWTPTRTCGRTLRTAPARPWTRSSATRGNHTRPSGM
jgi:hypothetical protein